MMSMDTIVSFDALVYDPMKVQSRLEAYPRPGFKLRCCYTGQTMDVTGIWHLN